MKRGDSGVDGGPKGAVFAAALKIGEVFSSEGLDDDGYGVFAGEGPRAKRRVWMKSSRASGGGRGMGSVLNRPRFSNLSEAPLRGRP